jgi:hypothetical protein
MQENLAKEDQELRRLVVELGGIGTAVAAHLGCSQALISKRLNSDENAAWWADFKKQRQQARAESRQSDIDAFRAVVIRCKGDVARIAEATGLSKPGVYARLKHPSHADWWEEFKLSVKRKAPGRPARKAELATHDLLEEATPVSLETTVTDVDQNEDEEEELGVGAGLTDNDTASLIAVLTQIKQRGCLMKAIPSRYREDSCDEHKCSLCQLVEDAQYKEKYEELKRSVRHILDI